MTMIQSYDGTGGWRIFPFKGRKDPERTAAEDLKELGEQADFDGSEVIYVVAPTTTASLPSS